MRDYFAVYCAIVGAPVLAQDFYDDYGVRLLFCLYLPEKPNETVDRYLVTVCGCADRLAGSSLCDMLNDYYQRRGSSARCWSYSCVGHYFDGA